MSKVDKAVDRENLNPVTKKRLEHFATDRFEYNSVGCEASIEPRAGRKPAPCENVYAGQNNSYIVFGKDRPGSRLSGYGGMGHTHSDMIDICCGLGGIEKQKDFDPDTGDRKLIDPDVFDDAARVYISQKCDVDKVFDLANGSGNAIAKSTVAVKADSVRVISREGIKLISSSDLKNSRGGTEGVVIGIDLIAGNNSDDLQPLVKGKNLTACLQSIVDSISQLASLTFSMFKAQMEYNAVLACHWHFSPFFGSPTSCSPDALTAGGKVAVDHTTNGFVPIMLLETNCELNKFKYLKPVTDKFILSNHNRTN